MKRIALTIAAGLLATAGAAQAQYGPQYGPPPPPHGSYGPGPGTGPGSYNPGNFWRGAPDNPWDRIRFLQARVDQGARDGSLDRGEEGRVNGGLNGVRTWIRHEHWVDAGRLTPDQRGRLQGRLDQISGQIRWLRHNGW